MIKFYQDSWFDIPFKHFCDTDRFNVADETFYSQFYNEFFKKYQGYEELPEAYRVAKNRVVDTIFERRIADKILSIGSGNGYIEDQLADKMSQVIAVEPSKQASSWLLQNPKVECFSGFFPDALPPQLRNTLPQAYSVGVDYVFDNEQYTGFLKSIVDFGVKDYTMYQACLYTAKMAPKALLRKFLIHHGLYRKNDFQLWGELRSKQENIECFKGAGFDSVTIGQLDDGTWWVRGTTGDK